MRRGMRDARRCSESNLLGLTHWATQARGTGMGMQAGQGRDVWSGEGGRGERDGVYEEAMVRGREQVEGYVSDTRETGADRGPSEVKRICQKGMRHAVSEEDSLGRERGRAAEEEESKEHVEGEETLEEYHRLQANYEAQVRRLCGLLKACDSPTKLAAISLPAAAAHLCS